MTTRSAANGSARGGAAAASWLVLLSALFLAAFITVDQLFVHTARGQEIDNAGLAGSVIGRARIIDEVDRVLNLVSVSALVLTVLLIAAIGAVRRRPGLALVSITLLAASNVSTQLLKTQLLHRPNLGIDRTAGFAHNTLPSGHTTVGISVSAALLIVLPPASRGLMALGGAAGSTALGVATLSAGWHRPSDAIAACLVVGAWACGLGAVAAALRGRSTAAEDLPLTGSALLLLSGALALAGSVIALGRVGQVPEATGRRHLFLAYAGGSVGVAGAVLITMGSVLLVAGLIDPPRRLSRESRSAQRVRHAQV